MNKGGFSWKRFVGISRVKSNISRKIGIPLTKSGRNQKIGRAVSKGCLGMFVTLFCIVVTVVVIFI
jgi:hypothetical protein